MKGGRDDWQQAEAGTLGIRTVTSRSERPDRQSLVTAQAIGKYERDESMPSSGVLIALADALNVSVNYLVGDGNLSLLSVDFRSKKLSSKRGTGPDRRYGPSDAGTLPHDRRNPRPAQRQLGQA